MGKKSQSPKPKKRLQCQHQREKMGKRDLSELAQCGSALDDTAERTPRNEMCVPDAACGHVGGRAL